MKEQEGYFFEPRSLTGRKKQTRQDIKLADTVFETKVLKRRHNVYLFLQITSDCVGTEYYKSCTFAKRSPYFQGIYLFLSINIVK